jgi:hypothetical protein
VYIRLGLVPFSPRLLESKRPFDAIAKYYRALRINIPKPRARNSVLVTLPIEGLEKRNRGTRAEIGCEIEDLADKVDSVQKDITHRMGRIKLFISRGFAVRLLRFVCHCTVGSLKKYTVFTEEISQTR